MAHSKILISDSQLKVIKYDQQLVGSELFSISGLNLANVVHREQIRRKIIRGNYEKVIYMISGCDRSHYSRVNYDPELDVGPCRQEQNRHGFEMDVKGYEIINEIINTNGQVREYVKTSKIKKHLGKSSPANFFQKK